MVASTLQTAELDVGDQTLHVRVRAGSPTVLFLHGLAGYGGEWQAVVSFLPDDMGVIAVDQRGHGESYRGGDVDVDAHRWVDDAAAAIEAHGQGSTVVVGQSMGNLVAVPLAALRPDLVDALVVIEGGISAVSDETIDGLANWFGQWPPAFVSKREAREFFGADERSTSAWVAGLARTDAGLVARFDPAVMLATMHALGQGLAEQWKQIKAPTRIVQATASAIDESDIAEMLRARPDAELITVAGGHDLHLDEPQIVAGIIERAATTDGDDARSATKEP